MKTSDFDYDLPESFIAQTPIEPRDSSRLMVIQRGSRRIEHRIFREVGNYLKAGDLLVLNQTRVIPARLFARKPTGGRVELLLLRSTDDLTWECLVGGKGLHAGASVEIEGGPAAEVTAELNGSSRLVRFAEPIEPYFPKVGHVPLPPYIKNYHGDPERYQTVYASQPGSAAAPTAGLHFTPGLISHLQGLGVEIAYVTLHVGLDTFAPVTEQDPQEHKMHSEWCELPQVTADAVQAAKIRGGRVIAVGTTSVRTLESAAQAGGDALSAFSGPTILFILPGFSFKVVDALITNFHLPRSTLIMLVSAFASREMLLDAYETAKREGYRFYSFGDAMLII